ncbi:MAG: restriction endonuclease subunit S [Xanthomonadaceae bacterium]|nr:restriction endonuclease subunit S [Xanthomonadaceae bacterium]
MQGWQSLPFEACIEQVVYSAKVQRKDFLAEGAYPIVSQEEAFINGFWDQEADIFRVDRPLVVFGDHTRILKYIDFDFVLGADGVKVLKPKSFLHPRFFYYQLHTAKVDSLGYARHYRLLKEHRVAYPTYAEQQRIVVILDEAFEGIATAKANAQKNLRHLRDIVSNYLEALFDEEASGWVAKKLGQVCDFQGGSQPPKSQFVYGPKLGYIRFLQIRDFSSDKNMTYIPESNKNRMCSEDDILIGRYGASVGKILTGKSGAYNVALVKAIPDIVVLNKEFFRKYLVSSVFQKQLMNVAARSAQNGFSKEDISEFLVPLPSLKEQQEIVDSIKPLVEQTLRLERVYSRKMAALEDLKKSLLHQAFTGQL